MIFSLSGRNLWKEAHFNPSPFYKSRSESTHVVRKRINPNPCFAVMKEHFAYFTSLIARFVATCSKGVAMLIAVCCIIVVGMWVQSGIDYNYGNFSNFALSVYKAGQSKNFWNTIFVDYAIQRQTMESQRANLRKIQRGELKEVIPLPDDHPQLVQVKETTEKSVAIPPPVPVPKTVSQQKLASTKKIAKNDPTPKRKKR